MYSFNPLPAIDTLNNHSGFQAVAFICVVVVILSLFLDEFSERVLTFIGTVIVLLISAVVSFNSGSNITPLNQKVTGTLVSFSNESYGKNVTSGKTRTTTVVRNHYVIYKIGSEQIMFPATLGQSYPEKAVLYYNPK